MRDQNVQSQAAGSLMQKEAAEASAVFLRRLSARPGREEIVGSDRAAFHSIYTVARGSSDAAATIFNYEAMAQLGVPATTLPPSIFSIGRGVDMRGALVAIFSQSGGSTDLIAATKGAAMGGARIVAITNVDGSEVEAHAHLRLPILAGPELAVPATKSVIGSVAAGLSLIAALSDKFAEDYEELVGHLHLGDFGQLHATERVDELICEAEHIYVVGRKQMFGAAREIALKIKECCGIHAEAYSASEVLHGPLQLSSPRLLTLILDDGNPLLKPSLDVTETRFKESGTKVVRLRTRLSEAQRKRLPGSVLAADALISLYPKIHQAALNLQRDPDRPSLLNKITVTV